MSGNVDHEFPVHGSIASGFEPVRQVFERNFTHDIEVGAGFCAFVGDTCVVDLWGGFVDRELTTPWQQDTLVNVYSTTKGLASLAFAQLVEAGHLRYEDEVKRYWPEMRAAADGLTIGQLLSHQSGVPGCRDPIAVQELYDFDALCGRFAEEEPFWQPGTAAGYHAMNWGYLAGILTRRAADAPLGRWFNEETSAGLDCHIGLAASEFDRVSNVIGPNHARIQPDLQALMNIKMPPLYPVALQNPVVRPFKDVGSAAWRGAEIAAANGHATAHAVAATYQRALSGKLFSAQTLAALTQQEVGEEDDLVLGRPMRRGRGVILNTEAAYGPGANSFGHAGAGGSVGFADADADLAVGYVMNQMQPGIETDTRGKRLINAVYDCLSEASKI